MLLLLLLFSQVTYDLRFIQGMPDVKRKGNVRESLSALHVRHYIEFLSEMP